jgi:PAS domain S-box-containing protein
MPTVLLIQDYPPDQLESLRTLLLQFGDEVFTTVYGQDGLNLASDKLPDLIITDITLPDMSGIELCRRVRAHTRLSRTPILVVSGLRKESDPVLAALNAGATDYLRIPYDPVRLLAKIARLTERHRAEEASRNREKYFRLLIENSTESITFLDANGITLYQSPSIERILSHKPQDLVGQHIFNLIHPHDIPAVIDAFEAGLARDESSGPVQYRFLHKNGTWRVLESVGRRLMTDSGKFLAVVNTRDITELREAERQVSQLETQLEEARKLAHIGSFEWHVDTNEWTWSDELFRILGLEPQSAPPTDVLLSRHLAQEDNERVMTTFKKAVADHQPMLIEHRIVRADGTARVVRCRGQAVAGSSIGKVKLSGTFQDITELK